MKRPCLLLLVVSAAAACGDPPALLLEIDSDLRIPTETNSLLARISVDGEVLEEESYVLGASPRHQWPQTLPLVAGDDGQGEVEVAVELRLNLSGEASVVVGFASAAVAFPNEGVGTTQLSVPRDCDDRDADGYGVGFGCRGPDCDDGEPTAPEPNACTVTSCNDTGDCAPTGEVCYQLECAQSCTGPGTCGSSAFECTYVSSGVGACTCRRPCTGQPDCRYCDPGSGDCIQWTCTDDCCLP